MAPVPPPRVCRGEVTEFERVDLKGLGYLMSTISVFFLGIVAWPGPDEPQWKAFAVLVGMILSIMGMGVRFASHQQDRKDIRRAAYNRPPEN